VITTVPLPSTLVPRLRLPKRSDLYRFLDSLKSFTS
jgi:hypothetical protein